MSRYVKVRGLSEGDQLQTSWGPHSREETREKSKQTNKIETASHRGVQQKRQVQKAEHSYENSHNPKWQKGEKAITMNVYAVFLVFPDPEYNLPNYTKYG